MAGRSMLLAAAAVQALVLAGCGGHGPRAAPAPRGRTLPGLPDGLIRVQDCVYRSADGDAGVMALSLLGPDPL